MRCDKDGFLGRFYLLEVRAVCWKSCQTDSELSSEWTLLEEFRICLGLFSVILFSVAPGNFRRGFLL
jgi:hypothetical protein